MSTAIEGVSGTGLEAQSSQTDAVKSLIRWESPHPLSIAGVTYRVRIGHGDWQDVAETVRIVRTACRFGGSRPYFVCPGIVNGVACDRRVGLNQTGLRKSRGGSVAPKP